MWLLCLAQAKRDAEAVKLRNELETRISTLEGYADRMDTKFGDKFVPGEDGRCDHSYITSIYGILHNPCVDICPDIVEDFYDQLEGFSQSQSINSQTKAFNVLSGVTAKQAGWLSRTIRENIVKEKEKAEEEIESELNVGSSHLFPPTTRLIDHSGLSSPSAHRET